MDFMTKDEAIMTMHLFGAASENEGISKLVFKEWVVRISSCKPLTRFGSSLYVSILLNII